MKSQKRLIGTIAATATMLALLLAIFLTPTYRSTTLLAPAQAGENAAGSLAALTGKLGAFGSLAGLGGVGGSGSVEAMAILNSRAFTEKFLLEEKILPVLYEDMWDPEVKDWHPRKVSSIGRIKASLKGMLATISGDRGYRDPASLAPGPSMERAVELFSREIRHVSQDDETQLVTLTIEWQNPVQAASWARLLVKRLNQTTRQRAIDEGEKSIRFLEIEAINTNNAKTKTVIYSLMEDQMNKAMLANVNEEFSFQIIDPAVVPEKRSSPKRAMIVILGLFAGLALGIFAALIRGAVRAEAQ